MVIRWTMPREGGGTTGLVYDKMFWFVVSLAGQAVSGAGAGVPTPWGVLRDAGQDPSDGRGHQASHWHLQGCCGVSLATLTYSRSLIYPPPPSPPPSVPHHLPRWHLEGCCEVSLAPFTYSQSLIFSSPTPLPSSLPPSPPSPLTPTGMLWSKLGTFHIQPAPHLFPPPPALLTPTGMLWSKLDTFHIQPAPHLFPPPPPTPLTPKGMLCSKLGSFNVLTIPQKLCKCLGLL